MNRRVTARVRAVEAQHGKVFVPSRLPPAAAAEVAAIIAAGMRVRPHAVGVRRSYFETVSFGGPSMKHRIVASSHNGYFRRRVIVGHYAMPRPVKLSAPALECG